MKVSVIIPAFNEESTIAEVIDRVAAVDLGMEREIIVVDDGSRDRTLDEVRSRAVELRVIHENRINLGKGSAVRVGLTYATGDIVMLQDADLELDPAEHRALLEPLVRGETNVVNGSRLLRPEGLPLGMRTRNLIITALTNALYGSHLTDALGAYKAFRRDALDPRSLRATGFELEAELCGTFLRAGERIVEVPVSYRPRTQAQGKKVRWTDVLPIVATLIRLRLGRGRSS